MVKECNFKSSDDINSLIRIEAWDDNFENNYLNLMNQLKLDKFSISELSIDCSNGVG